MTTSSTTGFGFVAINPVTCNNVPGTFHSSGTFAGSEIPDTLTAPVGTTKTNFVTLPYDANAHTPMTSTGNATAVMSRVVACSAIVNATTANINQGGKVRMGQTQAGTGAGVDFAQTQDLIVGNAVQFSGDFDKSVEWRWQTSSINDLDFNNYYSSTAFRIQPFSQCAGGTLAGYLYPMYILAQAPVNPAGGYFGQTFDVVVTIVVEYTGFVATGVPVSYPSGGSKATPGLISAMTKRLNDRTITNVAPRKADNESNWFNDIAETNFARGSQQAFEAATRNAEKVFGAIGNLITARQSRPTQAPRLPPPEQRRALPAPTQSTLTIEDVTDDPNYRRRANRKRR